MIILLQTLQPLGQPARNFGTTGRAKAGEVRVVRDRHNARHDRDVDSGAHAVVDKAKVGVGIVEILGDR